jgi:Trehalose utilisation
MKTRFCSSWVIALCCVSLAIGALQAQTPPPESTSKVKRVLLYNYNGGWNCADCRKETQKVFFQLAQAKGFAVDTSSSISDLTLENLKRYQVIAWNNNHGGVYSVSDTAARMAVSAYIQQGGGWLLVNIANEHLRSWRFLDSLIGPGTGGWVGSRKPAALVPDSLAQRHSELRFVVDAMPDSIPLRTNWLTISEPIDDLNHVQVIYRLKNADWITTDPNFIPTYRDHYVWASTHEQGKALSIPLGWYGGEGGIGVDIMSQADSAVPKLYWQGLR